MAGGNSGSHGDPHHDPNDIFTGGGHHVVPFEKLRNVALWLIVLTVLTVVTAKFVHMGVLAAPTAFLIAAIKAWMVMAWFMGLKLDTKMNRLIFGMGFLFLAVFYGFAVLDVLTRVKETSTL